MITKHQRHPTDAAKVVLHVTGSMALNGDTIEVADQAFRDALEAASADANHRFFGNLED